LFNDDAVHSPETSSPEAAKAIRSVLYSINLVVVAYLSILLIFYIRSSQVTEAVITALSLIPILAALELTRRGKTQAVGGLLAIALLVMVTALATAGQGIHDIGIMAYPSILLIISLIVRKNNFIFLTVLAILCTAWLIFGEEYGFFKPTTPAFAGMIDFLIVSGVLLVNAYFIRLVSNTLHKSLVQRSEDLQKRLNAETALREAETTYRAMVEQTTVVTYRDAADLIGTSLFISPQIKDLIGYTPEEWTATPEFWKSLVHPDDLPLVIKSLETFITTGKNIFSEYRLRAKDGHWVWVRDESALITDEGQATPHFIYGVLIDITEQKIAEHAVKQREAILSAVAKTAQLLLKTRNWRTQIDQILQLLGEATGASHVYLFENHPSPDGRMLSSQRYEWAAQGIQSELDNPDYQNTRLQPIPGIEDWFKSLSSGKHFYGSAQQYPEYWEKFFELKGLKTLLDVPILVNGKWWGIIGFDDFVNELPWSQAETDALLAAAGNIATAIERQLADEELRASENKFNLSFHQTFVPMVISRKNDSVILDVNLAFSKATGYSQEETIGKTGRELNIWGSSESRDSLMDMLEKKGVVNEFKMDFRTRDGGIRTGLLSVVEVQIAAEKCLLYSVFDISKIEQLVNELKAKNDELQAFTYTVSHDLKAPLVTISGFMGYLDQDIKKGDAERIAKDIQRINDAIAKMQRLFNELLELSRIGRLTNSPETIPFIEVVNEALSLVEGRLKERQVEVRVEADLPSVFGDRARLVQVIQNLVDNAAKFMGSQKHPLIEIGADHDSKECIYYVRDNGIGIAPEFHERVFGLFNKLDAASEGTGIGLALVKRIIDYHGGRIWVESQGLGKGTGFFFTLPH
jgi:PAS domain S-box-containing protein